jgi:hypothetical protein
MPRTSIDLTGQRIGRITVLSRDSDRETLEWERAKQSGRRDRPVYWRYRCDCGAISSARTTALTHGKTSACRSCAQLGRSKPHTGHLVQMTCACGCGETFWQYPSQRRGAHTYKDRSHQITHQQSHAKEV